MGKAYNAGKSPVLKVFTGGLRLLPAACVALRAGTHNTETVVIVAVVRVRKFIYPRLKLLQVFAIF